MREKKNNRMREKKKTINRLFPMPQIMRQKLFQKGNRKKLKVRGKLQEKEGEDTNNNISSNEEVRMPTKKKPLVKQRKSIRLASKGKRPVVSLNDDSSTHTSCEPKQTTPPSPKPDVPPSPILYKPPPTTTPHSLGLGFTSFSNPSVFADPILDKLQVLQSKIHSFQDEVRVILHHPPVSLHK